VIPETFITEKFRASHAESNSLERFVVHAARLANVVKEIFRAPGQRFLLWIRFSHDLSQENRPQVCFMCIHGYKLNTKCYSDASHSRYYIVVNVQTVNWIVWFYLYWFWNGFFSIVYSIKPTVNFIEVCHTIFWRSLFFITCTTCFQLKLMPIWYVCSRNENSVWSDKKCKPIVKIAYFWQRHVYHMTLLKEWEFLQWGSMVKINVFCLIQLDFRFWVHKTTMTQFHFEITRIKKSLNLNWCDALIWNSVYFTVRK